MTEKPLARCATDGLVLTLVAYDNVVMIGCALCGVVEYDGPRLRWERGVTLAPRPRSIVRTVLPQPTCWVEAVRAYALGWRPSH